MTKMLLAQGNEAARTEEEEEEKEEEEVAGTFIACDTAEEVMEGKKSRQGVPSVVSHSWRLEAFLFALPVHTNGCFSLLGHPVPGISGSPIRQS